MPVRMVRGDALTPQRFWDRVVIPEFEVEKYEAEGYVKSHNQEIDMSDEVWRIYTYGGPQWSVRIWETYVSEEALLDYPPWVEIAFKRYFADDGRWRGY